jgi:hypothetical protein
MLAEGHPGGGGGGGGVAPVANKLKNSPSLVGFPLETFKTISVGF